MYSRKLRLLLIRKAASLDICGWFYSHTVGPGWMNINDWLLILFVLQHTQCCGISKCYTMGWRIRQFNASATTIQPQTRIHYYGRRVPGRSWRKTHTHTASWRKLFLSSWCLRCHQSAAHFKGSNTFDCFFLASICSPRPFLFSDNIFLLIKALRKRVETLSVWIIETAVDSRGWEKNMWSHCCFFFL